MCVLNSVHYKCFELEIFCLKVLFEKKLSTQLMIDDTAYTNEVVIERL